MQLEKLIHVIPHREYSVLPNRLCSDVWNSHYSLESHKIIYFEMDWRWIYEYVVAGFLQMFVCIFGIIGNSISVVVLTRPEMKSSPNVLLLGLALADNMYLIGRFCSSGLHVNYWFSELELGQYQNLFEIILSKVTDVGLGVGEFEGAYTQLIEYIRCRSYLNNSNTITVYCLLLLGLTASTYFIVAITLERFVVVLWPLKARSICTVKTAWKTAAMIFMASLIYAVPEYFAFHVTETKASDNVTTIYFNEMTEFGNSYAYLTIYVLWMFGIFNYIIPFTTLIILNTAIYLEVYGYA